MYCRGENKYMYMYVIIIIIIIIIIINTQADVSFSLPSNKLFTSVHPSRVNSSNNVISVASTLWNG